MSSAKIIEMNLNRSTNDSTNGPVSEEPIVKVKSFIDKYLDFTSTHEAPEIFHKWCAISTIAATLNRKCFLIRASGQSHLRYVSYPGQMLITLVAGSGRLRKSTTVGFAQKLLRDAKSADLYDGKISPERLLQKLGKSPNGAIMTLIADELSYFLSKAQYAENMVQNILELSAAKDEGDYETKGEQVHLRNVCLTGLFATTPRSLGESIPETAHDDGFMSRFIWVFADKPRGKDAMFTDEETMNSDVIEGSKVLRDSLIKDLQEFSGLQGKFKVSTLGREWYQDWYNKYADSPEAEGDGWGSRVHEHLIRVAMTLGVSEHRKLFIDQPQLTEALEMLNYVSANLYKATALIGRHGSVDQQKRILNLFAKGDIELSTKDIIRKTMAFFKDVKELHAALDTLEQAGILKVVMINAGENNKTWKMSRG